MPRNVALSERRRRGERADGEVGKGKGEKGRGKGKGKLPPSVLPAFGKAPAMMPGFPHMPMMRPMMPGMAMPRMPLPMPGMMPGGLPLGMPGLMPGAMPGMPGMPPMMKAPQPRPPAFAPLNRDALEKMPPQQLKQHLAIFCRSPGCAPRTLGERLYAHNYRLRPDLAGKLTGRSELGIGSVGQSRHDAGTAQRRDFGPFGVGREAEEEDRRGGAAPETGWRSMSDKRR